MVDAWEKIAAWCAEQAGETAAAIRSPQAVEDLHRAQRDTGGYNWPDAVLAFYAWCDGAERTPAGYLWPGFRPLSLIEVVQTWRELVRSGWPDTAPPSSTPADDLERAFAQHALDLVGDHDFVRLMGEPAGTATGRFLPVLLPIAEDQSGSLLVCDRRWKPRTHHGAVAEFDREEGFSKDAPWRSLSALASATFTAMRTGRAVSGTRLHPVAVGGRLTWNVSARDPLELPDGVTVELPVDAGWTGLPDTDLEVTARSTSNGIQLRYRRRPAP